MARDAKLWLFMGGGLVLGAGVFGWYFLVGDKAMQQEAAQKPIAQWDAAWVAARTCLLGDVELAAAPADVLRMRELLGARVSCRLADLDRPEGMASGVPEIEAAWADIDTAWHALVKAQGDPDAMGPPIAALDHARAALRAAAGMADVPGRRPSGGAIAALAPGPAITGTAGVPIDRLEPRGHVLGAVVDDGDPVRGVVIRGPAPADAVVVRAAPGVIAAVPSGRWGATSTLGDDGVVAISAGPLDGDGHLGDGAVVLARRKVATEILGGLGDGAARALVVADAHGVSVIRSKDGGDHWDAPVAVPGAAGEPAVDRAADALVLRGDSEGFADRVVPYWTFGDPAAPPTLRVASDRSAVEGGCLAGTIWYVGAADGLLATAVAPDDSPRPIAVPAGAVLRTCSRDAVAISADGLIHRCSATICDAGLAVPDDNGRAGFVDVFDGSGVVYARQSGRLIGVWRTGVAPRFVRAPAGQRLIGVAVWAGVPTFALAGADGLHTAALP